MKTLSDVKNDMATLYDEIRDGSVELKTAAELANVAGKFLKADQLELAREMFMTNRGQWTEQKSLAAKVVQTA